MQIPDKPEEAVTPVEESLTFDEETYDVTFEEIMHFVTTRYTSLMDIKEEAKNFDLVVTQAGRRGQCDRITFGLKSKIRKVLGLSKQNLFTFNKNKNGLFSHGENNVTNVELFMKYQEKYFKMTGSIFLNFVLHV